MRRFRLQGTSSTLPHTVSHANYADWPKRIPLAGIDCRPPHSIRRPAAPGRGNSLAFIDLAYGRRSGTRVRGVNCAPKRNVIHPSSCTNPIEAQADLDGRMHSQNCARSTRHDRLVLAVDLPVD